MVSRCETIKRSLLLILLGTLLGATISTWFVAQESYSAMKERLNADKVLLQITSNNKELTYSVNSYYFKSKKAMPIKQKKKDTFIIKKSNVNDAHTVVVTIKDDEQKVCELKIDLSLMKADAIEPTETKIKAKIKWNSDTKEGNCKVTLTRHPQVLVFRRETVRLVINESKHPVAYFEM